MIHMAEERIVVTARQQKPLKALAALLGGLGFTKISYSNKTLTVEKMKGQDIKGKPYLDYRVEFKGASIELSYTIPPNRSRVARLLELLAKEDKPAEAARPEGVTDEVLEKARAFGAQV